MVKFNTQEPQVSVSVVIATLGGSSLKKTIDLLNMGTIAPTEILICIPKENIAQIQNLRVISNVRVVESDSRGQVCQRAQGLAVAKSKLVMQIDDDVQVSNQVLETLVTSLLLKGSGNVIAPIFKLNTTGKYATYRKKNINNVIYDLYATIICGARLGNRRYGTISVSGVGYGILPKETCEDLIPVEWLPGGVAICFKDDLVLDNYYPFPGKAYSEDLIHSVLWRSRGIKLWINQRVDVLIDVSDESFEVKEVWNRYKAHAYVARLLGKNSFRTKIWFVCYLIKNIKKIMWCLKPRFFKFFSGNMDDIHK